MILDRVTTQNFRNLRQAETSFHPRVNILVGRNGQGKTNLLESIYFLATTKSFRTTRISSVFEFGSPSVFVSGVVLRDDLERTLSVGLETLETRRRLLMINGEKVSLPVYVQALSVLAYSAARLDVIRGTPDDRRRFLDRGIAGVSPAHVIELSRYGRVLRQRNALLAKIADGAEPAASLDVWDEELASTGAAIQSARAAYVAELSVVFTTIAAEHAYNVGDVELRYEPNRIGPSGQRRAREIAAGLTLAGPQRDLFELTVDGRAAAEVLSGGEQKMAVLFLKFAKAEMFRRRNADSPLFLLDDIDAELDLDILQKLLSRLPATTQVFATSAKESFLASLEAGPHRRLTLENGVVMAARDFT